MLFVYGAKPKEDLLSYLILMGNKLMYNVYIIIRVMNLVLINSHIWSPFKKYVI